MKIITQISLFDDTQNENLGDLERLQKVIEFMPDEKLIRKLEGIRGKGRNEWPVAAMWNSFIASFIFNHRDYKFEKHTVRGLEKMEMFLTVTFLVSLTLAKVKTEAGITEGLSRLYA